MNYQFRINPTPQQRELMLGWLETCRRLYNKCLHNLKDWLASRKCSLYSCSINREYIISPDIPFPSYLEQKRQLTQWKKTNPYLKEVHSQVTQDCVKRLHNTWERFKSKKFGFPRFKSLDDTSLSCFHSLKNLQSKMDSSNCQKLVRSKLICIDQFLKGFKLRGSE